MPGEKAQRPERARDPEELSRLLATADSAFDDPEEAMYGFDGPLTAVKLYDASGGFVSLARAATDIAESTGLVDDVGSTSFADFVAARTSMPEVGLAEDDQQAAAVLSHLFSSFTKSTALLALSSLRTESVGLTVVRDPEGALMRLQMAGVLARSAAETGGKRLRVPTLLAGKLRQLASGGTANAHLVSDLVSALVGHIEWSQFVEESILADALTLARRNGQWHALGKLYRSLGLVVLLRAPQAACSAYAGLPKVAVECEADLELLTQLTDHLQMQLREVVVTRESMRRVLVEQTGPDRLSELLAARVVASVSVSEKNGRPVAEVGYHQMVRQLLALAQSGRHTEAASLGTAWANRSSTGQSRQVVRLLAAVSEYHSSQPRNALAMLREIEEEAFRDYVDGDFLLPATLSWSALIAAATGDVDSADEYLLRAGSDFEQASIVDELVSPPLHVASALRAVDRLDLDSARKELDKLDDYPELHSLEAYPAAIRRLLAILSEKMESGLLHLNDEVERFRGAKVLSAEGGSLLIISRSLVFISLGQLKLAEVEIRELPDTSDAKIVLTARLELVAGRCERVIALADKWFYHQPLRPRSRADMAAIKAAALLRSGREREAEAEFQTAIRLAALVRSLLPIAMIPQQDRNALIDATIDDEAWNEALDSTRDHFRTKNEMVGRLREIGSIAVAEASLPQLSGAEGQLLKLLDQGLSISQMSRELSQVTGTVKNRLSALYRKFDVSSREELLVRARSLGFLSLH
ncbi:MULTISPECIES: helix-turn-helix transcriptional regulator [Brevibacterium]|uniref:helix-turn-helix transcriptional regulator n=1 Tax=Brevibacterium TaxID=1696 RepID=UPI00142DE058|nr:MULTISPECIES: helix-turn-helix transcriptional regulator [Brevibacterium]